MNPSIVLEDPAYPDHCVQVDDRVWRGARPTRPQADRLHLLGVRSSLCLQWEVSDIGLWPDPVVEFRVRDVELLPSLLPEVADDHVIRCLRIIRGAPAPVYVHCRSGENRTGVVVAAYHIVERGDLLDEVLEEFFCLGGLWQYPDAPYIRSIAERREFFLASV